MTRARWVVWGFILVAGIAIIIGVVKKIHPAAAAAPPVAAIPVAVPAVSNPAAPVARRTNTTVTSEAPTSNAPASESTVLLHLLVQDSAGHPLPDAQVKAGVRRNKGAKGTAFNKTYTTGPDGTTDIPWPAEKLTRLQVTASKNTYGARNMAWDLSTGDKIPADYTLTLKTGISIGGFVVDTTGTPIPDAAVSVYRFWTSNDGINHKGEEIDFTGAKTTTDPQGHWHADNLPPELLDHIDAEVKHPDFLGTNVTIGGTATAEDQFRAGTYKFVLTRGLFVRGRVVDQQDNPVPDATVSAGEKYHRDRHTAKTDANGDFTFNNLSQGNVLFSILAKGHQATNTTIAVSPDMSPIVFKLATGNIVYAHVQNENGEGVAKAQLGLEGDPGQAAYDAYEFSGTADANGDFVWDGAPPEPMPFYIFASGYSSLRNVKLFPGQTNIVKMTRARELHGLVLDDATRQPITSFHVTVGRAQTSNGETDLLGIIDRKEYTAPAGKFTIRIGEASDDAIRISADEYTEQIVPLSAPQDGIIEMTFLLNRGGMLEGTVVSPSGEKLPDVKVAPSHTVRSSVQLKNGNLETFSGDGHIAISDANGRFKLPAPPDDVTIVAAGNGGFGSASVAQVRETGVIVVQSYGRIEGIAKIAGQPAAGQELLLDLQKTGVSAEFDSYKVTTDNEGKFTFERVPAGSFDIVRLVKTGDGAWRWAQRKNVTVSAGQTVQVTLGDIGATLRGHARPETIPSGSNVMVHAALTIPRPPGYNGAPLPYYFCNVDPDGSFLFDSVVPNDYTLNVTAEKPGKDRWDDIVVAAAGTTVTVPDNADPLAPIDLPEMILTPSAQP